MCRGKCYLYKYSILYWGAFAIGRIYLSLVYVPCTAGGCYTGRADSRSIGYFATWNPYKALWSLFVRRIDIIGFRIQNLGINVSQYFIDMLPYLVTITVLVVVSMRKSREKAGPKAWNSYSEKNADSLQQLFSHKSTSPRRMRCCYLLSRKIKILHLL